MSSQVTTAFVQQYRSEVFHLSQQKGSRLQGAVRMESQKSESQFFDRIGLATAVLKVGRHSDTPQIDSAHSRRRVTLDDYEWADLIDKEDLRRMLQDPAGDYAMAAAWALGRSKDDVIIAAADAATSPVVFAAVVEFAHKRQTSPLCILTYDTSLDSVTQFSREQSVFPSRKTSAHPAQRLRTLVNDAGWPATGNQRLSNLPSCTYRT